MARDKPVPTSIRGASPAASAAGLRTDAGRRRARLRGAVTAVLFPLLGESRSNPIGNRCAVLVSIVKTWEHDLRLCCGHFPVARAWCLRRPLRRCLWSCSSRTRRGSLQRRPGARQDARRDARRARTRRCSASRGPLPPSRTWRACRASRRCRQGARRGLRPATARCSPAPGRPERCSAPTTSRSRPALADPDQIFDARSPDGADAHLGIRSGEGHARYVVAFALRGKTVYGPAQVALEARRAARAARRGAGAARGLPAGGQSDRADPPACRAGGRGRRRARHRRDRAGRRAPGRDARGARGRAGAQGRAAPARAGAAQPGERGAAAAERRARGARRRAHGAAAGGEPTSSRRSATRSRTTSARRSARSTASRGSSSTSTPTGCRSTRSATSGSFAATRCRWAS